MKRICPKIECQSTSVIRYGYYSRKSDHRKIQVFRCKSCKKKFSTATGTPEFGQNKRMLNHSIYNLLCCSMSRNRIAWLLKTSKTTVDRKLVFLSAQCQIKNQALLAKRRPCTDIQFDELETFEHTKCKPLSVAMAVEYKTRLILGFEVSQMAAKGPLAKKARSKYGVRKDRRLMGLRSMFTKITPYMARGVQILSDQCPNYKSVVRRMVGREAKIPYIFCQTPGGRGCSTGQGELKKLPFDPLFSLNHSFAMVRYGVSRLVRRTWCTTKKVANLEHHLQIYAYFHNRYVLGLR